MNIYKSLSFNYYISFCVIVLLFLTSCVTFISQSDYQEKFDMIISKEDMSRPFDEWGNSFSVFRDVWIELIFHPILIF